jgi:molybdate transport system ATP-binding protein
MSYVLDIDVQHTLGAFSLNATFQSDGRVTALFGPSGSGKTSLVNVIGGLIRPTRGRVLVNGETLVDTSRSLFVPKHRRRIGYVFQDARLFPHLTVQQNLLFGRWFSGNRSVDGGDVDRVVDLLGINHLLSRRPHGLSGGEKRRVAIGRALLTRPRLLLMDEPLASLDDARKLGLLPYIERLRDEIKIPIVYVSHSVFEVARLATTLVILDKGIVRTVGPTGEVMSQLDAAGLRQGRNAGSLIEAEVQNHDLEFGLTALTSSAGELQVSKLALPIGAPVRVRILVDDVLISLQPLTGVSALNVISGSIREIKTTSGGLHPASEIRLDCNGQSLLACVASKSVKALGLAPGKTVFALIKSVSIETANVTATMNHHQEGHA